MKGFICTIEEALELQRHCLSDMVASWFYDRRSRRVFERNTAMYDIMRLSTPNDLIPAWTVLDLGRALGTEIRLPDGRQLEVIHTNQYSGLRDEITDRWYRISTDEACFELAGEASNRARLLIFCLQSGLLNPEFVNQSISHHDY